MAKRVSFPSNPKTSARIFSPNDSLPITTFSSTDLNYVEGLFKHFREKDITIVYGNLGRHPVLLQYMLRIYFSWRDRIAVYSPFPVNTCYSVENIQFERDVDFLFVLEPYFGYHITKPSKVRHLIILTSHLSFHAFDFSNLNMFYWHYGKVHTHLQTSLQRMIFVPPIFHDLKSTLSPNHHFHFDVTCAKSAHEAYLRLLTGREQLRNQTYTIVMNCRDEPIIQQQIDISRQVFFDHIHSPPNPTVDNYWNGFETTQLKPDMFRPQRIRE